jgi:hypothetical protein
MQCRIPRERTRRPPCTWDIDGVKPRDRNRSAKKHMTAAVRSIAKAGQLMRVGTYRGKYG